MKNEIVGDDIILNIVNGMEKIAGEDEIIRFIEVLEKDIPDEVEKLEEALINYMGENDL